MADVKISGLPSSTTPLAGTEVLPIVQSGVTKQVSVANLTAGRNISTPNIALTSAAFDGVSEIASRNAGASTGNRRSFWLQQGNANFTGYMAWGVNGVASDTDAVEGLRFSTLGLHIGPANNAAAPLHIQNATSTSSVQNGIRLESSAGFNETMQRIQWVSGVGTAAYIDAIRSQAGFAGTLRFYTSVNPSDTPTLALSINETQDVAVNTGNLVIGTSGKGIDFSATAGTGTSELLADYEEGTWTPDQGPSLTVVGAFSSSGIYTKIGRTVTVQGSVSGATSVAIATTAGQICTNLPFASSPAHSGSMFNASVAGFGGVASSANLLYSTSTMGATTSITFSITYTV